ncbi:OprO/OprP family phosphate-selective porin [Candidatus Latescibacterota bacterium]
MKKWNAKRTLVILSVLILISKFSNISHGKELSDLEFGGRMMVDWAWMSPDDDVKDQIGDFSNGSEFRRIWMYTSGSINDNIDFKIQFDFTNNTFKVKDLFLVLKGLPVTVKAGHMKEPFSLENMTSSKYLTFMERALPELFSPKWNSGLQLSSSAYNNRLAWAAGVFGNTASDGYSNTESGYNFSARVSGLPMFFENGSKLIHLGLSVTNRNTTDEVVSCQGPEMNLAPDMVNTKEFSCDKMIVYNGETAAVYGPFSLQGEVFSSSVSNSDLNDPSFFSYYALASYFITGEHREYKSGSFTNVEPLKSFRSGGIGAVELAARYSYLDLDGGTLKGGKLSNITVGVNCHLNSYSRIMFNYVRSELVDVGVANILGSRIQFFF